MAIFSTPDIKAGIASAVWLLLLCNQVFPQVTIPDAVLDTFDQSCAFSGCHSGPEAPKGLDLTEEFAAAGLVNRPSKDFGEKILRVKPGDPARSYLLMKIKGADGIKGKRMPKKGTALSAVEIDAIEAWIRSLPPEARAQAPARENVEAFPGLTLATLPTTQTLESGKFAYRIAHRWRGKVDSGIDQFFGLDSGARIFTQLLFAIAPDVTFSLGRTSEKATYEVAAKWRLARQRSDGSIPASVALVAGFDWASIGDLVVAGKELSRTDGQRFHFFGQLPISRRLMKRFSLLAVPGILFNGNTQLVEESALITLGFGVKYEIMRDFSIFVEGVPIISGSDEADVVGAPRTEGSNLVFNDAFTIGLEKRVGGHVFHIYVTNSPALSTDQVMSGSDLDFTNGDLRLGFNIYRKLGMPF